MFEFRLNEAWLNENSLLHEISLIQLQLWSDEFGGKIWIGCRKACSPSLQFNYVGFLNWLACNWVDHVYNYLFIKRRCKRLKYLFEQYSPNSAMKQLVD